MTYLLDANVLIARAVEEHVHHAAARRWLSENQTFAVCPVTQLALARYLLRANPTMKGTLPTLFRAIAALPGFEFWPDDFSLAGLDFTVIQGHQQVTDAYLVALAESHGGRLATFDEPLATIHPTAILLPADLS